MKMKSKIISRSRSKDSFNTCKIFFKHLLNFIKETEYYNRMHPAQKKPLLNTMALYTILFNINKEPLIDL